MKPVHLLALATLALGACGSMPRDAGGTLDRVRAEHRFRLGVVDGAASDPREKTLVAGVAAAAQASPAIVRDAQEPLLLRLEAGELDLVVGGRFAPDSGWKQRVWLGPALARRDVGESRIEARPAARNGENGWIVLVDRAARALEVAK